VHSGNDCAILQVDDAQTIGNKEYEDTVRQSALEVVVSLCESSPAMMRRQGAAYIAPLIEQCMTLMAEIEEDEEWYVTDQVMDDDDEDELVARTLSSRALFACLEMRRLAKPVLIVLQLLLAARLYGIWSENGRTYC
jgi:hypothetical protein